MILLDGAMGTMIQGFCPNPGRWPELLCFTAGDEIENIQRAYISAGSNIIYTNTFGATAHKLNGCDKTVCQVVGQAVKLAKSAATGSDAKVALDVGPLGISVEPFGDLSFDAAYAMFREEIETGAAAGADLIAIETMTDLNEARAALLAAKDCCKLPVFVTMSFEATGRTYTGCTVGSMCMTLDGLGADALGFNCSMGPDLILPLVKEAVHWTDLPIIVKPNAGMPDPVSGKYDMTPDKFAAVMAEISEAGAAYIGGCCGTTPEYIRVLGGISQGARPKADRFGVCSAGHMTELNGVRVIGERINPTGKKKMQAAIREKDWSYIQSQGVEQADAGADILDVNVGLPGCDETEAMTESVRALQKLVDLPLQIDSTNPAVIEAGLRSFAGKAIVNSVNGEESSLNTILPLVKKYGAAVIGLCMDGSGIPQTAEQRILIAERILKAALSYGIRRENVIIDCLTLTASAQQSQAGETLKAVEMVTQKLGLHTALGVSNISFGLPAREQITRTFLTSALTRGLDLPIINPNQTSVMDAVAAFRVLSGEDGNCESYIARFSDFSPETAKAAQPDITAAIAKGLGSAAARLTDELLQTSAPMDIVDNYLIPALDLVGENYEKGKIFLPQLVNSANAACEAFAVIRKTVSAESSGPAKGRIVMATVKGDIHDIGKNITRTVLENYGYDIIDLGVDAAPEDILKAAMDNDIHLVGLSAMMTTTVPAMEQTIALFRSAGYPCKIWVGGAVLTESYAKTIGADFYAADAKQSVDIAKAVFEGGRS